MPTPEGWQQDHGYGGPLQCASSARRAARGARETLGRPDGERNLLACSGERQKQNRLLFILESQMTRLLEPVFLNFTDGEWDTEPVVGDALRLPKFFKISRYIESCGTCMKH